MGFMPYGPNVMNDSLMQGGGMVPDTSLNGPPQTPDSNLQARFLAALSGMQDASKYNQGEQGLNSFLKTLYNIPQQLFASQGGDDAGPYGPPAGPQGMNPWSQPKWGAHGTHSLGGGAYGSPSMNAQSPGAPAPPRPQAPPGPGVFDVQQAMQQANHLLSPGAAAAGAPQMAYQQAMAQIKQGLEARGFTPGAINGLLRAHSGNTFSPNNPTMTGLGNIINQPMPNPLSVMSAAPSPHSNASQLWARR